MSNSGEKLYMQKLRSYFDFALTLVANLILGGSVAALFLLARPKKAMDLVHQNLFNWRMLRNRGLPTRQLEEVFELDAKALVNLTLTPPYLRGWYATFNKDRILLASITQILQPSGIFEIGTLRGWSALLFALNSPDDCVVYSLDLPADNEGMLNMRVLDTKYVKQHDVARSSYVYTDFEVGRRKVRQLYGDSASFDFSAYENKIDLFFIDGAHSYDYVQSDTLRALRSVREGGVIAWHDYGRGALNGVSKYLEELRKSGRDVVRLPGSSLAILRV